MRGRAWAVRVCRAARGTARPTFSPCTHLISAASRRMLPTMLSRSLRPAAPAGGSASDPAAEACPREPLPRGTGPPKRPPPPLLAPPLLLPPPSLPAAGERGLSKASPPTLPAQLAGAATLRAVRYGSSPVGGAPCLLAQALPCTAGVICPASAAGRPGSPTDAACAAALPACCCSSCGSSARSCLCLLPASQLLACSPACSQLLSSGAANRSLEGSPPPAAGFAGLGCTRMGLPKPAKPAPVACCSCCWCCHCPGAAESAALLPCCRACCPSCCCCPRCP